jgi:DNA-binding NarL/FixJ family response regulator
MHKIRVLLADDHGVVREGLKRLLEAEPDMIVVGEAVDGQAAVEQAAALQPDILLLDLSMPHLSGLEAARKLQTLCPKIRIVALTVHEDRGYLQGLLELGVAGYLLKRSAVSELPRAVRTVVEGGVHIDPRIASKLVPPAGGTRPQLKVGSSPLTERESDVLRRIAEGFSNKEVAGTFAISVKTVETHKARAMKKVGLISRVDIVRYALAKGWLNSD